MKYLIAILSITFLASTGLYGKKNAAEVVSTSYLVGISQVNSGTGHGTGYTINGGVIKGRKSLEVGLIYSEDESKLSGGDFKYKVHLGNLNRLNSNNMVYTPYLQYNLMYQKSMSYAPSLVELGGETYEIQDEPGMVATMGHYLAFGNKIKIFNRAYFDTSLGLGFYQGSLDHVNGPDTWGVHNQNNGMTFNFKMGIGYTFN